MVQDWSRQCAPVFLSGHVDCLCMTPQVKEQGKQLEVEAILAWK
jgi:hypothetical protein